MVFHFQSGLSWPGLTNDTLSVLAKTCAPRTSYPVPGRPTTLAYGRSGACCACSRCGMGGICFMLFFFKNLSSFSNASSIGRRLDNLKYCGLGRSNSAVVVSYYRKRAC